MVNIYYLCRSFPKILKFKFSDAILLEKKRLSFFTLTLFLNWLL